MQRSFDISGLFEIVMQEVDQEIYIVDPLSLDIRHTNRAAANNHGNSPALNFAQLLDEDEQAHLKHVLDACLNPPLKLEISGSLTQKLGEFSISLLQHEEQALLVAIRQAIYESPDSAKSEEDDSEVHYHAIVSNIPGLIYQMRLNQHNQISFPYLSDGCENLLELTPEVLQANPSLFIEKIVAEDRYAFLETLLSSARNLTAFNWEGRINSSHFQDIKWISLRSSPRKISDDTLQWDGIMNNITQSKKEKHQIEESHRLLAELSFEMEKIKENERLRIAREIHDDMGGNLTAIKIGLSSVIKKIGPAEQQVLEKLQQLEYIVDQTFEAVHRIASDLRPDVLELGIVDALTWQAKEFEKQIGIRCIFNTNNRQKLLSPDQDITLFRICQEALSNIAKHANADEVNIALNFEANEVIMCISDNGVGIDPENMLKRNSFGLRGMAERISALKGSFEIKRGSDKGTVKTFKLPITGSQ